MLMETINQMNETMGKVNADAEKAASGNKAAGTRLRKNMQVLKKNAQDVRLAVTAIKNQGA